MLLTRFLVVCGLTAPLISAADREFQDVVHSISREFQTRPVHIPLFGLVNAFLFAARPGGAQHIDLAVFENLNSRESGSGDLEAVLANATSRRWSPFVKVRSRRNGRQEQTLIFMRQEGGNCRLLVTAIEPNEATVIQLKLNTDATQRWLKEPRQSPWAR